MRGDVDSHVAAQRRLVWKLTRAEYERLALEARRIRSLGQGRNRGPAVMGLHDAADEELARVLEEACE